MLRTDHPASQRAFVMMVNEESRHAWRTGLTTSMKSGVAGFEQHYGDTFFQYLSQPENAEKSALFDAAMTSFSSAISGSLMLDWAPPANGTVCDIAGSKGHMLAAFANHYPGLQGVVFDLPDVAERAKEHIASLGLSD